MATMSHEPQLDLSLAPPTDPGLPSRSPISPLESTSCTSKGVKWAFEIPIRPTCDACRLPAGVDAYYRSSSTRRPRASKAARIAARSVKICCFRSFRRSSSRGAARRSAVGRLSSAWAGGVGATAYSFGLPMSLAVVLCCYLLSSSICGVVAWRNRRDGAFG